MAKRKKGTEAGGTASEDTWYTFDVAPADGPEYALFQSAKALVRDAPAYAAIAEIQRQISRSENVNIDSVVADKIKGLDDGGYTGSALILENFCQKLTTNGQINVTEFEKSLTRLSLVNQRFGLELSHSDRFAGVKPLKKGQLSESRHLNNVAFHKGAMKALWLPGYYKNRMVTNAELVQIPTWFNLDEIVDAEHAAFTAALEKYAKHQKENEGKDPREVAQISFGSFLGSLRDKAGSGPGKQNSASFEALNSQKDRLFGIYQNPSNQKEEQIRDDILSAAEARGRTKPEQVAELIDDLYNDAIEKKDRLIGRVDCVYGKGFSYFRKVEKTLMEKAENAAVNGEDYTKYLNMLQIMRAKKLDLARKKYPTDPDKFRAFINDIHASLDGILDEDECKSYEKPFDDVLKEIEKVEQDHKLGNRAGRSAVLREMTCDPGAICLSFGGGNMLKYERNGQTVFSFINIPKDQRQNAIATAFKVLNDRGDFWRGDIVIEGPSEFYDEVVSFARSQSLRISAVHGAHTHRMIYEEVSGEIAGDPARNFGRGVVSVTAFVCDKNGNVRLDKAGNPMTTQLAIGSKEIISAKGWPSPKNLLKNFMIEDYPDVDGYEKIRFPSTMTDDNVFSSWKATFPKFGVYIPDDDDFLFDAHLVPVKVDDVKFLNQKLKKLAAGEAASATPQDWKKEVDKGCGMLREYHAPNVDAFQRQFVNLIDKVASGDVSSDIVNDVTNIKSYIQTITKTLPNNILNKVLLAVQANLGLQDVPDAGETQSSGHDAKQEDKSPKNRVSANATVDQLSELNAEIESDSKKIELELKDTLRFHKNEPQNFGMDGNIIHNIQGFLDGETEVDPKVLLEAIKSANLSIQLESELHSIVRNIEKLDKKRQARNDLGKNKAEPRENQPEPNS